MDDLLKDQLVDIITNIDTDSAVFSINNVIRNHIVAEIAKKYENISYTDYEEGFNAGLSFAMDIVLDNNNDDIIKDIMGA